MVEAGFSCRLCDSPDLALYYAQGNAGQFRYFKCRRCELVNLDLANGLDQAQFTREFRDPMDESAGWDLMLDATFEFIGRHLPDTRSLCDIGCGNGRLLYLGKLAGWKVLGLELTPEVAARTAKHLDVEVIGANFLDFEPGTDHAEAYDVVCLRHVLEHLPDSKRAMRKIAALLRPGGHALLEFPNVEAVGKRVKRALASAGLHQRQYKADFMPGHCNEYSLRSFEHLLSLTGFELVRWETYSRKPLANWLYNRLAIGNNARALVRKIGSKPQTS